ncbi:DUF3329 domain-containing protein [Mesorhizobium sp. CN2-181]|uniref:DUF3329 domain-containing protein n=1 Tax=Mesorhizobium yinganensis TaxID=3157707 RepID=UPI0032B7A186
MANDRDHPWLRPLWLRVAIVVLCAIWSGIEFYTGEALWGTLAGGMAVYAAWMYVWTYPKPQEQQEQKKE